MALDNLLSVSGKSGLFRLVGQMKNGIIVESLVDGKRFPIHGSAKVSALEEISIYTEDSEIPLKDVFARFYEKSEGKQVLSHNSDKAEIKAFFNDMVPEHDEDRVYVSDMVKVVKWFNQLVEHTDYDPAKEEEEAENAEGETSEAKEGDDAVKEDAKPASKKKPAAKTAAKTQAPRTSGPKASSAAKSTKPASTSRKSG